MVMTALYFFAILSAAVVDVIFLMGFEIEGPCHWVNILHLSSFAMLFGMNLWMISVPGLLLLRNIPRHQFGKTQSVLSPAFNCLSFSLSCLTLSAIFLQYPYRSLGSWGTEMLLQVTALSTAMITYVLQLLFIGPKSHELMTKIYLLEREAGVGEEIAIRAPPNEELQMNPEYKQLRSKFGMWHGISALAALLCVLLLCYHVNYLAGKFTIFPSVIEAGGRTQETIVGDIVM